MDEKAATQKLERIWKDVIDKLGPEDRCALAQKDLGWLADLLERGCLEVLGKKKKPASACRC